MKGVTSLISDMSSEQMNNSNCLSICLSRSSDHSSAGVKNEVMAIDLQEVALKQAGCNTIYVDKITAPTTKALDLN